MLIEASKQKSPKRKYLSAIRKFFHPINEYLQDKMRVAQNILYTQSHIGAIPCVCDSKKSVLAKRIKPSDAIRVLRFSRSVEALANFGRNIAIPIQMNPSAILNN